MEIYGDGASKPNPGETAFAIVIPNILEAAQYCGRGSNQTAELMALRAALLIADPGDEIFSDSQYAIRLANGEWKPKVHLSLVKELRRLAKPGIRITWIKGHADDPWQQRADLLASRAAKLRKDYKIDALEKMLMRSRGKPSDGNFAQIMTTKWGR